MKITVQTFTSSGTYTPTAGMTVAWVRGVAGGGGGAGSSVATRCGGGGGAGGYEEAIFLSSAIGASQSITVGSGGTAGSSGGTAGSSGGTTTFGALLTMTGGSGGQPSSAATTFGVPGAGGAGSGGNLNMVAQAGFFGQSSSVTNAIVPTQGGLGGSSPWGGGGMALTLFVGGVSTGSSGAGFGSGGQGGINANGGSGAPGKMIIWDFV